MAETSGPYNSLHQYYIKLLETFMNSATILSQKKPIQKIVLAYKKI